MMTLGPAGVPYEAPCSSTLKAADRLAAIQIPPKSGWPSARRGGVNSACAEAVINVRKSTASFMLLPAITRGSGADLPTIGQLHATGVGRVRSILRPERVDGDAIARA